MPVTSAEDVFFALKIDPVKQKQSTTFRGTPEEQQILKLISEGIHDQEELALETRLAGPQIASVLTMLEINGHIRPEGAGNWTIA